MTIEEIKIEACKRYRIIDESDFDDTSMSYDEYVSEQEAARELFFEGAIFVNDNLKNQQP
jgi:hypothetical protein